MRPAARVSGAAPRARAGHARRPARGFTLVEILVVIVIIGIVTVGMMLSVNLSGSSKDPGLDKESQRLIQLIKYAREQAELQTREYGLYAHQDSYEFMAYDNQRGIWREVDSDDVLRPRQLPSGITLSLMIDGRAAALPKASASSSQSSSSSSGSKSSLAFGAQFSGSSGSSSSSSSSSSSGLFGSSSGFGSSGGSFFGSSSSSGFGGGGGGGGVQPSSYQNTLAANASKSTGGGSFNVSGETSAIQPQVMIFSSGDMSAFELTVQRDSTGGITLHEDDQGDVVPKTSGSSSK